MSEFKNYFDNVDTKANTAAECGEIRSRAAKIKKRRKIATSSLGVTLAVMMTTTVAVSAAGGWSISEIIGRWFKGNTELITDNLSTVTAENVENSFEFINISPNGAVVDDNMIVFFLDVTRNDGNIFDSGEYAAATKDGEIFYDSNGETRLFDPHFYFDVISADFKMLRKNGDDFGFRFDGSAPVRQYLVDDGNPADNSITIAFCCDKSAMRSMFLTGLEASVNNDEADVRASDASGNFDYEIKSLKLKLGGLTEKRNNVVNQYKNGGILIDSFVPERIFGSWDGELKFDIKYPKNVSVQPNREAIFKVNPSDPNEDGVLEKYDYSFNVDKITVSQMSVSFELNGKAPEQSRFLETWNIGEIIMKNGDTVAITSDGTTPSIFREGGNINERLSTEYTSETWHVSA
ncbi:MAG: hypothetical protein K2J76_07000, partial [Oscillospiraceae bacterium]|nr:hypothetical protein [Oscillospiraceae bacterium]